MSIRILLADDHALLRMGLSTLLGCERDMQIVGEAADGEEAVERAAKLKPDVVIMDLAMPKMDGVEATRQIHAAQPKTRVLVLTSYGTSVEISRALAAGASGVIVKDASSDDLPDAIRRIAAGERVLSSELLPESDETLSERQGQILDALIRGLSNNEIATLLDISPSCVKQHTMALYKKLGAANRTEAVAIAMRKQLLKI